MPVLFFSTLSGTLFFIAAALLRQEFFNALHCTFFEFNMVLLKSLTVSSSWICVYYAMRELPISLASPIRSTSPLWTMLGGIIIYREIPTFYQGAGMVIILLGYILFSFFGKTEGFSFKSKGMQLIIAGTLLGAASALFDKYLLNTLQFDREMLQLYFSMDLVILTGAAWGIRTLFGHKHHFFWRWSIPATGILLILADYLYFYALSMHNAPISIVSLLRRCSCIITFFFGAKLFHDTNLKRKACALILLLAGAAMLALAK